jgi:hypothetical protein
MKLTISMATMEDYDGVFFTIQSLRMHHKLPADTEFLVLDNSPTGQHTEATKHLLEAVPNSRWVHVEDRKSSFIKYEAFKHATGDIVLGLDCHVLLEVGFIDHLLEWWGQNQRAKHQLTGPLLYSNLKTRSSHMNPEWRGVDFGTWGNNVEAMKGVEPFEVPMQGMGCFSFWRGCSPPILPDFHGFGAEEWYIAEKVRKHGGKTLCHPKMGWMHRFGWPKRAYAGGNKGRIINYYRGWLDLYKSLDHPLIQQMTKHWLSRMPESELDILIKKATLSAP